MSVCLLENPIYSRLTALSVNEGGRGKVAIFLWGCGPSFKGAADTQSPALMPSSGSNMVDGV